MLDKRESRATAILLCSPDGTGWYPGTVPPEPTVPPPPTATSIPVGTITARAVQISPSDTSCSAIKAVSVASGQINGTTLQFTPSSASQPAAQIQAGANYVTFASVLAGSYTLDAAPPIADWAYARPCWTNVTTGSTGEGLSATLGANQTLQWDIGYTYDPSNFKCRCEALLLFAEAVS